MVEGMKENLAQQGFSQSAKQLWLMGVGVWEVKERFLFGCRKRGCVGMNQEYLGLPSLDHLVGGWLPHPPGLRACIIRVNFRLEDWLATKRDLGMLV